jgi:hypothetical protein
MPLVHEVMADMVRTLAPGLTVETSADLITREASILLQCAKPIAFEQRLSLEQASDPLVIQSMLQESIDRAQEWAIEVFGLRQAFEAEKAEAISDALLAERRRVTTAITAALYRPESE